MKKPLLTLVVLATLAVSAVFAGNANRSLIPGTYAIVDSQCVDATDLEGTCNASTGTQCTAVVDGINYPAYKDRAATSPFECSQPYLKNP